ncbi:MAG: heavy metal translocating P-type ATPase, partial [Thermoanaerobaculia bacterium]|nr:heavy metal translocating P-type ATPase [Thermoanaerobaculia bacterium]
MTTQWVSGRDRLVLALALGGLLGGGVAWFLVGTVAANLIWAVSIALVLVPLSFSVVRALLRGNTGVDLIALIAMGTSLAFGENLAGA